MARRLVPEAPGHAQVDDEHHSAFQPDQQVLASALERHHAFALESRRDDCRIIGPGQPLVVDPRRADPPACDAGRESPALGLDLRQLRQ